MPDYQEVITITVEDVDAPEVTVDDRTVEAPGKSGAEIDFPATAIDAVDGELPVSCEPESGSRFKVGTTKVTCEATDSAGNTGKDTAEFTVLAPPVPNEADVAVETSVVPAKNYVGRQTVARFVLTNAGPKTAENVVVTAEWPKPDKAKRRALGPLTGCTLSSPCSIKPGARLVVAQAAVYREAESGDLKATVSGAPSDPDRKDNKDSAHLRILQPKLTVTPKAGPPGQAVLARGKDFPPGSTVSLTWKPGITAARSPVRVGRDGEFEAPVLVLRKDQIGPRKLRADVRALDRLQKPFLVVQRHLEPPDFAGRG